MWQDSLAVAISGIALFTSATTFFLTRRRDARTRYAAEKRRIYSAFLVRESMRLDAYQRYKRFARGEERTLLARSNENLVELAENIDRARALLFETYAELMLIAPSTVIRSAEAYNKRVSRANPLRSNTQAMTWQDGRDLREAFYVAARKDLHQDVPRFDSSVMDDSPD